MSKYSFILYCIFNLKRHIEWKFLKNSTPTNTPVTISEVSRFFLFAPLTNIKHDFFLYITDVHIKKFNEYFTKYIS